MEVQGCGYRHNGEPGEAWSSGVLSPLVCALLSILLAVIDHPRHVSTEYRILRFQRQYQWNQLTYHSPHFIGDAQYQGDAR